NGIIAMASLISIAILFINIVLICFILDEFLRESYHQRSGATAGLGLKMRNLSVMPNLPNTKPILNYANCPNP
ncbi:hypothetical protein, partial [Flavobacterium psychrophilum]|uniref:hypothetical protein n=1 Tax=Flavobacterium psychrophilum TaxID=96345 RepID=UPI001D094B62